ncbi:Chemotaxis protein motC [Bartonella ancashensis]|uniref:Chemotaxis protein motC n=1 Tax=Bartonella ancashensis TaxID=1318743 RepID=A0A0M4M4U5_9HYPH|nr:Chemotaxis protein motC [Bartonella ancashensis]
MITKKICKFFLFIAVTQGIFLRGGGASSYGEKRVDHTKENRLLVAQVEVSSAVSSSSVSDTALSRPVQLVRSLQSLQDQVVLGQEGALQKQGALLKEIGEEFLTFDANIWQNESNLHALLIYLFNGGNPQAVKMILENKAEKKIPQNMIKGALAYASYKRGEFLRAFEDVGDESLQSLPPALFLSIILSTIVNTLERDSVLAMKKLDQVRLLAVGTLFEESAIRSEIKVAATLGDIDLLTLLVRNYRYRFKKSPYSPYFWREFRIAVSNIDKKLNDEQLETLISYAPKMVQLATYTDISRTALLDARMERVHLTTQRALTLARDLSMNDMSIRLYYAASLAGSTSAEEAARMLQEVSCEGVSERDCLLLSAAQNVANRVSFALSDTQGEIEKQVAAHSSPREEILIRLGRSIEEKNNNILPVMAETDQFIEKTQEKINIIDQSLGDKM